MGIMKYFKIVMKIFFQKYETCTEKNKILKFLKAIANIIVISWFTFELISNTLMIIFGCDSIRIKRIREIFFV